MKLFLPIGHSGVGSLSYFFVFGIYALAAGGGFCFWWVAVVDLGLAWPSRCNMEIEMENNITYLSWDYSDGAPTEENVRSLLPNFELVSVTRHEGYSSKLVPVVWCVIGVRRLI